MKKKVFAALMLLVLLLCTGCGGRDHDVKVVIPAGSTGEEMIWSDEEISPRSGSVKLSAGDGLGDCSVGLLPTEGKTETAYDESVYLTHGISEKLDAEKGAWFRVGVSMGNDTDQDLTVYVHVENVDVRIQ